VQEAKSSIPFQEKSSTLPTPRVVSSSRSSRSAKSIGVPPAIIGCRPPSAVRPDDSRLNQMFGNAVNLCHATPIVGLSESTIIQVNEMTILTIATR
jgi:hypothetical protein